MSDYTHEATEIPGLMNSTSPRSRGRVLRLILQGTFLVMLLMALLVVTNSNTSRVSADHITKPLAQTIYQVTFATSGQSKWGPSPLPPVPTDITLFDLPWNAGAGFDAFLSTHTIFGSSIGFASFSIPIPLAEAGVGMNFSTSGRLASGLHFRDWSLGEVLVNYPIEPVFTYPRPDTYRAGDPITIQSSFRVLPEASLDTNPPGAGTISLDVSFNATFNNTARYCFFFVGCLNTQFFVIPAGGLPQTPAGITFPIIAVNDVGTLLFAGTANDPVTRFQAGAAIAAKTTRIGDGNVSVGANGISLGFQAELLRFELPIRIGEISITEDLEFEGCLDDIPIKPLQDKVGKSVCGRLQAPFVETESELKDDGTLEATGSLEFAEVTIDPLRQPDLQKLAAIPLTPANGVPNSILPVSFKGSLCDLGIFLAGQQDVEPGIECPATPEDLEYAILTLNWDTLLRQDEKFRLDPTPRVRLTFPVSVSYAVSPCEVQPCQGLSNQVTMNLGNSVTLTAPSDVHIMDVTPEFLLPNSFSKEVDDVMVMNGRIPILDFGFGIAPFPIIPRFQLIPQICVTIFGVSICTPEVAFPGLSTPEFEIDPSPVCDISFVAFKDLSKLDEFCKVRDGREVAQELGLGDLITINLGSLFGPDATWELAGFNTFTLAPFQLDREVRPAAHLTGPTPPSPVNEGQEVAFSGSSSVEIDIGEVLAFDWDFGDGIVDSGVAVTHAYADNRPLTNPPYIVTMVADDGHQETDTDTATVQVNNVAPTLTLSTTKRTEEGALVDLSVPPFNRDLVSNGGAEGGATAWAGLSASAYSGVRRSAFPLRGVTLVDNNTPGFYRDLGRALDGSSFLFPANDPRLVDPPPLETTSRVVIFEHPVGGNSHGFDFSGSGTSSRCLRDFGWDDIVSRIEISNAVVTLYEHCRAISGGSTGKTQVLVGPGSFTMPINDFGHDILSEFDVRPIDPPPFFVQDPPFHPTFVPAPEPATTHVAGNWLGRFRPPNFVFTGIPRFWADKGENAIVYEIDAGEGGITDVMAHFAVDNGVWVWVNGVFKFGAIQDNGAFRFEYFDIPLGDLPPGPNYIQVLRSDDFSGTDYQVLITGTTYGGRPAVDSQGPYFRGNSFFFGGAAPFASATRTVDVSAGADLIDRGGLVTAELSAYIGGIGTSDDSATVAAIFRDAGGAELGRLSIGPVTRADRGSVTKLLSRISQSELPSFTRRVDLVVTSTRTGGNDADGYVDNLRFFLFAPSGAVARDPGIADTHTGTINWGDGSPTEAGFMDQEPGVARMLKDHVYADNNPGLNPPYVVNVVVQDDDHAILLNGQASGTFDIIVENVPPIVTPVDNVFPVGETKTVTLATFTDQGRNDSPWTAAIDWGDGSPTTPGVVDQVTRRVTGTHQFTGPGVGPDLSRFGSVTVTDKDGGFSTAYFTNVVTQMKIPAIHASPDRDIVEGGSLTGLSGGFTAINTTGFSFSITYRYRWDYGDGTSFGPVTVAGPVASGQVVEGLTAPDHSYGDDGQFVVTFTVLGYNGADLLAAATDSFTVHAANAAAAVSAGANRTVAEGAVVPLSASYADPGASDLHTSSINWGDGSPPVTGVINETARTVTDSHVYKDNGAYTVTVSVRDDDGAVGTATFLVTVTNAAPVVSAGANQAADEGAVVRLAPATFTDGGSADTHTASIDWGDGTPQEAGSLNQLGRRVSGSHLYTDNGNYTVVVCVTDDDHAPAALTPVNGQGCGSFTVSVANVAPQVVAGVNRTAREGGTVGIGISTFTDPSPVDTHTATITWGDGTSSAGTVDAAVRSVTASHVYADEGAYTVAVQVCDDNQGCGTDAMLVTVSNAPPEILSITVPSVLESAPVTITASIRDKGTLDTHTATVNWGDKTAVESAVVTESPTGPPGSNAGASVTVSASHRYPDNGTYIIKLCVTDDLSTTCQEETIRVQNVAPAVVVTAPAPLNEGAFLTLAATFSDGGYDSLLRPSQENFTATINWGDGSTEPVTSIALVETSGSATSPTTGTVLAVHAYGKHGSFTPSVCVTDDDHNPKAIPPVNGRGCSTTTVTVNNLAPALDLGPDRQWNEGLRFTLSGAFSDPGYASQYTATVNWGDGTTEPVGDIAIMPSLPTEGTVSTGVVQAIHHYADNGTYTILACLSDGLATVCDTLLVTVENVAPAVNGGVDQKTIIGQTITLDPASFSDPGFDHALSLAGQEKAENFTATTNWGDGSITTSKVLEVPGAEGRATTGTGLDAHAYAAAGTYTVTVEVCDDDAGCSNDTMSVLVFPVQRQTYITDSQFRTITSLDTVFTPDKATNTLKLSATNPGTYFYNEVLRNVGVEPRSITMSLAIPGSANPALAQAFCLKGSMPIKVYADLARTQDVTSQATINPAQPLGSASSGSLTCVSSLSVRLSVPAGGLRYITVHLDFNLKGATGYPSNADTTYRQPFQFIESQSVDTSPVKLDESTTITAVGKRVTAIGGLALDANQSFKSGLKIQVLRGATVVGESEVTPPDGYYFVMVPAGGPYTVVLVNVTAGTTVKSASVNNVAVDQYVQVDFLNLNPADLPDH